MLEPPERLAVYNAVAVARKIGAQLAFFLRNVAPSAERALGGKLAQGLELELFGIFTRVHFPHPLAFDKMSFYKLYTRF